MKYYETFEDFLIGELGPMSLANVPISIFEAARLAWEAGVEHGVNIARTTSSEDSSCCQN